VMVVDAGTDAVGDGAGPEVVGIAVVVVGDVVVLGGAVVVVVGAGVPLVQDATAIRIRTTISIKRILPDRISLFLI